MIGVTGRMTKDGLRAPNKALGRGMTKDFNYRTTWTAGWWLDVLIKEFQDETLRTLPSRLNARTAVPLR